MSGHDVCYFLAWSTPSIPLLFADSLLRSCTSLDVVFGSQPGAGRVGLQHARAARVQVGRYCSGTIRFQSEGCVCTGQQLVRRTCMVRLQHSGKQVAGGTGSA